MTDKFKIVSLNYVCFYVKELDEAIAFYSRVFGPPEYREDEGRINGWKMGDTWLTIFSSDQGVAPTRNPGNAEFAVQVDTPEEVDRLYRAFVEAGAKDAWAPEDTQMYEPMRFSAVDDPFGMRIDIYCPLNEEKKASPDQ